MYSGQKRIECQKSDADGIRLDTEETGVKGQYDQNAHTRPSKLKYLGFGFYKDSKTNEWKCRPHQDSVKKFKNRLKELTCRKMPGTVTSKIEKINQATRGWINYYALGSMKTAMIKIDAHCAW